jgi:hypothetical protein
LSAAFIIGTALILAGAAGAVYLLHNVYSRVIDTLSADNIDLRNRLFISKGQPPTGIDVTAQYEEKKEVERVRRQSDPQKKSANPLQRIRDGWKQKDQAAAAKGVDITSRSNN